jgi:hypothetical protein
MDRCSLYVEALKVQVPRYLGITALPALFYGQQLAYTAPVAAPTAIIDSPPAERQPPKALSTTPDWALKFDRWFDLREMDFSLRYRGVFDSNNAHEYNQAQQRSIVDGKFKFDATGRYGIVFHASTGKYFNWAYADFMGGGNEQGLQAEYAKATPLQLAAIDAYLPGAEPSGGWSFYVRRLYLDLEPVHGIELQYGSLDINRGDASEITTYDNDGYITGERILIKRPKNFFFDEASITYAYFGDLYTPNFFVRGERLGQSNYHQFLVRKQIAKRIDASFDYTWQDASNTWREDARFKVPESRVVDSVRVEFYERPNEIAFRNVDDFAPGAKGFAITADKEINKRLSVEGGIAEIDPHQGVLTQLESSATLCMGVNGDAYGLGKRYFVHPTIKINHYMVLTGYYTHEFGAFSVHDQIVWNKEALNAGFIFNIKDALFPPHTVK